MVKKDKPFTMYISDVSKLFHDNVRKEAERRGLNSTYIKIFMILSHQEKVTQNDIVNFTHHKAPTISLTLQKMEAEGLIERISDENDLRSTIVKFTDKGKQMDKDLKEFFDEKDKQIEALFTEEEKIEFIKKMNEVINYLDENK